MRTHHHVNGQVNSAVLSPTLVWEGGSLFGDNTVFDVAVIFLWQVLFPPWSHEAFWVL